MTDSRELKRVVLGAVLTPEDLLRVCSSHYPRAAVQEEQGLHRADPDLLSAALRADGRAVSVIPLQGSEDFFLGFRLPDLPFHAFPSTTERQVSDILEELAGRPVDLAYRIF